MCRSTQPEGVEYPAFDIDRNAASVVSEPGRAPRVYSLDVLRGIAIVVMLVLHRIHYHWPAMANRELLRDAVAVWQVPFVVLAILLLTMAGVFYLLSGTVNAYSKSMRTVAAGGSVRPMLAVGLLQGCFLLALHFVYRVAFVNGTGVGGVDGEPEFPCGQLTGLLREGEPVAFQASRLVPPGTLSLLGLITIVSTCFLALLLRNGGADRRRRNELILGLSGLGVIVAYPFVAHVVNPRSAAFLEAGQLLPAFVTAQLAQTFGLFPHLGYALIGAAIGLRLVQRVDPPRLLRGLQTYAWVAIGLGAAGIVVLTVSGSGVSRDSPVTGGVAAFIGLGVFLWCAIGSLRRWEFKSPEMRRQRLLRSTWLRRFGRLSLTVYLLEPILGEAVHLALSGLFGAEYSQTFPAVVAMGLLCVGLWHVLLRLLEKGKFVATVEWLYARLVEKVTGLQTGKLALPGRAAVPMAHPPLPDERRPW